MLGMDLIAPLKFADIAKLLTLLRTMRFQAFYFQSKAFART